MITTCPECGKEFDILYPDLWRYRRGDFLCSYGCMRKHDKREEENGEMKRLKKDGSPAQRPGPKPKKIEIPEGNMTVIATKEPPKVPTVKVDGPLRIETPEAGKVEVVPVLPEKPIEFKITGIDTAVGTFQYFKKSGYVDWCPFDGNGPVSMNLEEWKEFMKVFPEAMKVLGVEL